MTLTPEEQAELNSLNEELGYSKTSPLNPKEKMELYKLNKELGYNPKEGMGGISDEEFSDIEKNTKKQDTLEELKDDSVLKALSYLGKLGSVLDVVTGSTTARSVVGSLAKGKGLSEAEFAPTTEQAPTGKEIAADIGLSTKETIPIPETAREMFGKYKPLIPEKVSPAGIAGFAVELITDPTIFFSPAKIFKLAGKTTKGAAEIALKGSAKATDFVTGTSIASKGLDSIGAITNEAKETLTKAFNPSTAKDFNELKKIAEKHGIDIQTLPKAIEFGKGSAISKIERKQMEIGGAALENYQKSIDSINSSVDKTINNIAGGEILNKSSAGSLIRDSYDKSISDFFDQIKLTDNSIIKEHPDIKISEGGIDEINKSLDKARLVTKKVALGPQKARIAELKSYIDDIDNIVKTGNIETLKQTMEGLGEIAFAKVPVQETLKAATGSKELKDIYHSLRDAFTESVRENVGEDVASQLKINNAAMKDLFDETNIVNKTIKNPKIGNEELFDKLISRGDSTTINALREILPGETMKKLAAVEIDNKIIRNIEGNISYRSSFNNILKSKDSIKSLLTPNEITDITDLLKLGDRAGINVLSTSGTGASITLVNAIEAAKGIVSSKAWMNFLIKNARSKSEKSALQRMKNMNVKKNEVEYAIKNLPVTEWGTRRKLAKAIQQVGVTKESEKKGLEKLEY